jgi:Astacin (Peptidase family M12A)
MRLDLVRPLARTILIASALSACAVEVMDDRDSPVEVGVAVEALQCGFYTCDRNTEPTANCDPVGAWPNGKIPFVFGTNADGSSPDSTRIRKAMDDWQRITDGAIEFVPAGPSSTHVQTIQAPCTAVNGVCPSNCQCSGYGTSYSACGSSGCGSYMDWSNAYHELGHVIGLSHHFIRNDRTHYWWHYNFQAGECNAWERARCTNPSSQNDVDYGPFDFRSSLMYDATHPDFVRWDGSPLIPGSACGGKGPDQLPPGCPGSTFCPTCTDCNVKQPNGFPTKGDASAVVEMYRNAKQPGWKKFVRTINENEAPPFVPFDYSLSPGVTIPSTSSPALESQGGNDLRVYIRGSDNAIWRKHWDSVNQRWVNWGSLGKPSGSSTISDPAVVSWQIGRTDLVVRQDTSIFISSTPNLGTWQSLGGPSSGAASAPALGSMGPNNLDVFVRAGDNGIYHKYCTANCNGSAGTWSGWERIGNGTFFGKPAVATRDGQIDVFGHGMDHKPWYAYFRGGPWNSWFRADTISLKFDSACQDCTSPGVQPSSLGGGDLFVRDQNDRLWQITYDNAFTSWNAGTLGGVLTSSPGAVSKWRTPGFRRDIAVVMAEETTAGTLKHGVWWKKGDF